MGRVALIALAAAGLGGAAVGVAGGDAVGAPRAVLEVGYDEWDVTATGAVRGGAVTIREHNEGSEEHDLAIVRTDAPADGLPRGLEGVAPELAGEVVLGSAHPDHGHAGGAGASHGHAETHLTPGSQRSRTVRLTPGRYVLLCPLPGHYERGQAVAITVG